jgi:hypothetical protein
MYSFLEKCVVLFCVWPPGNAVFNGRPSTTTTILLLSQNKHRAASYTECNKRQEVCFDCTTTCVTANSCDPFNGRATTTIILLLFVLLPNLGILVMFAQLLLILLLLFMLLLNLVTLVMLVQHKRSMKVKELHLDQAVTRI